MRLHTFIITLRFVTFAALGVLGVFIFGVDPTSLTTAGRVFFFFSLWLLVSAGVTLILTSLARRFLDERVAQSYLSAALRQGMLIGAYVAGMALAQFFGYLTWWVALLALALMLLIEFTLRRSSRLT